MSLLAASIDSSERQTEATVRAGDQEAADPVSYSMSRQMWPGRGSADWVRV